MNDLVDMDGVLANFEKGFLDIWRKRYPDAEYRPLETRTTFQIEDDYPEWHKAKIWDIFLEQGFFLNLEPIPGSLEGIKEIAKERDIFICTAPLFPSKYCVPEKYEWVERHLGKEFAKRIILTKDKTLVRGRYLIDDKPEIKGICVPEWEQLVFEQPYNRNVLGKRRINWSNWKEVLGND